MKILKRCLLILIAGLAVLLLVGLLWLQGLAKDDGAAGRPAYIVGWTPPRGGPQPRADGYVMGSLGNDFILAPMPPARPMDIHRADSVAHNNSLRSCFWPGPKLRTGFYTTDPDDYGMENQIPDTMNTFDTAWFKLPEGAELVLSGDFPHMRHWSFTTYTDDGVPRDAINDIDLDPDTGSYNPFRPGVRRDVTPRRYRFSIVNGVPPSSRPANHLYTLSAAGVAVGMHMRNYVPDRSVDFLGSVALPEVELHLADGQVLKGEAACAATATPQRGKQVPLTVKKKLWTALNRLPWRSTDGTPAHDFVAEPMEKFYNRDYLIRKTFFPALAMDSLAVEKGGFWSNLATRYGYKYISQSYGKVYVVRGKMPRTPRTWSGDPAPVDQHVDMRYWSICTSTSPAVGDTVDCLFDEAVLPTVDAQGSYTVVVSRSSDRPANATEACGVAWMEWGNGDGIPGGSANFGVIINRHTHVNPQFAHSWFAVKAPRSERAAMGDYLPEVFNLRDKARFEALGCPVNVRALASR